MNSCIVVWTIAGLGLMLIGDSFGWVKILDFEAFYFKPLSSPGLSKAKVHKIMLWKTCTGWHISWRTALGWLWFGMFQGWWTATVATYCLSRPGELPKSKSTQLRSTWRCVALCVSRTHPIICVIAWNGILPGIHIHAPSMVWFCSAPVIYILLCNILGWIYILCSIWGIQFADHCGEVLVLLSDTQRNQNGHIVF